MLVDTIRLLSGYMVIYFHLAMSQFIDNQLCDKCICLMDDNLISCDKSSKMRGIPTNIDPSFYQLIVQYGNFRDHFIYKKNLTGLTHLNLLKVIYSKLVGVESKAFEDMKNLKYLDLSHNNIRTIQPFTFIGLNLRYLHLMENDNLMLLPDSFKGMYAESINLRSNGIKSIDIETFNGNNFKILYLYNNSISTLNPTFATIFSDTDMLIDLSGNPIDCNCEMKWLLGFLKMKFRNQKYDNNMKTVNFTCSTPKSLHGKEIIHLSDKDFSCAKPNIDSISIYLGVYFTQLTCVALGNQFRSPGVSWQFFEAENVKEIRRNPFSKPSKNHEKLYTSLSINVTNDYDSMRAFNCTTWLEDNYNDKILVNVKLPPQKFYNIVKLPLEYANKNNNRILTKLPFSNNMNFFNQKQFTILELIVAIIGTFFITIILLLIFLKVLRSCKPSQSRPVDYKTSNLVNRQCTMEQDSNHTYSHSVNNADYDVLKVYESHPPPFCQNSPTNRIGYIDYKTLDNVYSN